MLDLYEFSEIELQFVNHFYYSHLNILFYVFLNYYSNITILQYNLNSMCIIDILQRNSSRFDYSHPKATYM